MYTIVTISVTSTCWILTGEHAFQDVDIRRLQSVPAEPVVINKDYIVFTDKIKSGLVVYQTGTSKYPLNSPRRTLYTI